MRVLSFSELQIKASFSRGKLQAFNKEQVFLVRFRRIREKKIKVNLFELRVDECT